MDSPSLPGTARQKYRAAVCEGCEWPAHFDTRLWLDVLPGFKEYTILALRGGRHKISILGTASIAATLVETMGDSPCTIYGRYDLSFHL